MNDLLGFEGEPIADGPYVGRNKWVWDLGNMLITWEAHPYTRQLRTGIEIHTGMSIGPGRDTKGICLETSSQAVNDASRVSVDR
jgi:hypothetical protein